MQPRGTGRKWEEIQARLHGLAQHNSEDAALERLFNLRAERLAAEIPDKNDSACDTSHGFLVFHLDGRPFAVPSASVRAVSLATPVAAVPGAAQATVGVTSRRGRIIGVVDLTVMLHTQQSVQDPPSSRERGPANRPYFIWIYHRRLDMALGADRIAGLENVTEEDVLRLRGEGEVFSGLLPGPAPQATLVDLDAVLRALGVDIAG